MDSSATGAPVINEQIWEAWVLKGKLAQKATDRKLKIVVGAALVLLGISGAIYAASGA